MPARTLTGLVPKAYEHPSDANALNLLHHTAGLDTVVRKLNSWGFERLLRVELTGSYLRCTADAFPDLSGVVRTACSILDHPQVPDLYVGGQGELNALTAGVERPLILLSTGAAELLTEQELLFVVGHEVGHIKSAHVLYYQIAEFLPVIAEIVGAATFGVGELLSAGLQVALLRWKRMSELTADRAGMLACQDADVAIRTLMKLAGLPPRYFASINTEDFVQQAREFQAMDADKLSMLAKWLSTMGASHPWTVMRAQQLLQWVDSGGYEQALRYPHFVPPPLPPGMSGFCEQCGFPRQGGAVFCAGCGRPFGGGAAMPPVPPGLPPPMPR